MRRGRALDPEQVLVRDPREVDPARGREPVPLEEPRVDLHELVAAVARVTLELDLREPSVADGREQAQPRVHHLLHPQRLADATRAHEPRRLPELAAAEDAERRPSRVEVAAERVQRVVAPGNELLHHRLVLLRLRVGLLELGLGLAAEGLPLVAPLELDRVGRLHEHGEAELARESERLCRRARVAGLRHVDPRRLRGLELSTLVLDARELVPRRGTDRGNARRAPPAAARWRSATRRAWGRSAPGGRARPRARPGVRRSRPRRRPRSARGLRARSGTEGRAPTAGGRPRPRRRPPDRASGWPPARSPSRRPRRRRADGRGERAAAAASAGSRRRVTRPILESPAGAQTTMR